MVTAYKFTKLLMVDPDIIKGVNQINSWMKTAQLEEQIEIISLQREGNIYTLLCQITQGTTEEVREDVLQDDKIDTIED